MNSSPQVVNVVKAERDAALHARVVRRVPMLYEGGADAAVDRGPHVRAGSGLAWCGGRLAVVQDDANFVALVDTVTGVAGAVVLPAGRGGLRQFDDGRGNKAWKHDFESLVSVCGAPLDNYLLMALGSGSTVQRESVAFVNGTVDSAGRFERFEVEVLHAPFFYEGLRRVTAFSGSELNVEGAVMVGDSLRLFGRGNGALRGDMLPVNATCDVNWSLLLSHLRNPSIVLAPVPFNVMQYELGEIASTALSFTDAAFTSGGPASRGNAGFPQNALLYTAAAEASPDAVLDGPVSGSVIGLIEPGDAVPRARYTELRDERGVVLTIKVEGIAIGGDYPGQLFVVADTDDHDTPSELYEVRVTGAVHGRNAA